MDLKLPEEESIKALILMAINDKPRSFGELRQDITTTIFSSVMEGKPIRINDSGLVAKVQTAVENGIQALIRNHIIYVQRGVCRLYADGRS